MKRLILLTAVLASATAMAEVADPVRIDGGRIAGTAAKVDGVKVYRGIPFAAPPVGDLRWREPQPVPRWRGVRDGSKFGDVCVQPDGGERGNIALLPEGIGMSEDCLYLNVWTPAESARDSLPVMVYFYGGNYSEGAGSAPLYDGSELASKGAVVVTMNYRMGPLGFFAHPALTAESPHHSSGNYGIMDMLASLQWIHDNIDAFGGDPDRVTMFGQSAGAMALSTLVASPLAKGLVHRAISQSGTWMGLSLRYSLVATLDQAEERGSQAAERAGATTLEALRALSADDAMRLYTSGNVIIDGYVMPEDATPVFLAGRQNKIDVIAGSNKEELSFSFGGGGARGGARGGGRAGRAGGAARAGGPARAGGGAGAARGGGGRGGFGARGGGAGGANTQNDGPFWVARLFADEQAKIGQKAWLYYFAQNPPGPDGTKLPAVHASEVPYVFNNLGEKHLFPDSSDAALSDASADAHKVADMMSSYWVNFARTGNPNGPGLPTWQPHQVGESDAIILAVHPEMESVPPKDRLMTIDEQFEQQVREHQ